MTDEETINKIIEMADILDKENVEEDDRWCPFKPNDKVRQLLKEGKDITLGDICSHLKINLSDKNANTVVQVEMMNE